MMAIRPRFIPFPLLLTLMLPQMLTVSLSAQVPTGVTILNVRTFSIPFEIQSGNGVDPVKDVELLYSFDFGKRWHSADKKPVGAKKFVFNAEKDGEYWFIFRAITASGRANSGGSPSLRIRVDTGNAPQPQIKPSDNATGPVSPPKPARFRKDRPENEKSFILKSNRESENNNDNNDNPDNAVQPAAFRSSEPITNQSALNAPTESAPVFPGFENVPVSNNDEQNDVLDDIFGEMGTFFDVQPVAAIPNKTVSANKAVTAVTENTTTKQPQMPVQQAATAGKITGISLNTKSVKPQIIVKWNTGGEIWSDAQVDILRAGNKEGPWLPVSINLENKGEYWWFLTQEDMKPFFLTVRIRSFRAGSQTDTTQSAITIDPKTLK